MPPKQQKQLNLKRAYIKEATFRGKNMPAIYSQPGMYTQQMQMQINTRKLSEDNYEVSLTLVLAARKGDFEAYTVQVIQAGEFELKGYAPEKIKRELETTCLTMLFPLASLAVDGLLIQGNFPAPRLLLALKAQQEQPQAQQASRAAGSAPGGQGLFAHGGQVKEAESDDDGESYEDAIAEIAKIPLHP